jgi:hypothetical protein
MVLPEARVDIVYLILLNLRVWNLVLSRATWTTMCKNATKVLIPYDPEVQREVIKACLQIH